MSRNSSKSRLTASAAVAFCGVMIAASCSSVVQAIGAPPDNILLIVVDDIGLRHVRAYGMRSDQPRSPTLDRLAAHGVVFRNAWSNPVCAPGRAAVLTGRYAFRTGIGSNQKGSYLPRQAATIPKVLSGRYDSAAIGKWHLAGMEKTQDPYSHGVKMDLDHPRALGFEHFSGTMGNLGTGRGRSYYKWEKVVDGQRVPELVNEYATSVTTDDALAAIGQMREPWFNYVAYHAAHEPLHVPPSNLHSQHISGSVQEQKKAKLRAMIEALDTELGRLLSGVPDDVMARTTVIFVGDNGAKVEGPAEFNGKGIALRGKRTLYQAGISVPLIVAGARVAPAARGTVSEALVNTVDILATIAEIAGVAAGSPDSVSFLPLLEDPGHAAPRSFAYAERFRPNGLGPYRFHEQAIRDDRYKLIRTDCRDIGLFDLRVDPGEEYNLLTDESMPGEASLSLGMLRAALGALVPCRSQP